MDRSTLRLALAAALLALSGPATAGSAPRGGDGGSGGKDGAKDNVRREWVKQYDHNGDGRWRGFFGKDARKFKKDHPSQYEKLQRFCEDAREKPKKYDVKFPKDKKEGRFKCKKKKVDEPYLKAWIKQNNKKGGNKKEPETPTRRGGGGR